MAKTESFPMILDVANDPSAHMSEAAKSTVGAAGGGGGATDPLSLKWQRILSDIAQFDKVTPANALKDLETLIEIKRSTGRARDALVVPLLIAIRDRGSE